MAYPTDLPSPSRLVWNKIGPDFMFNMQAGTYLLRNDRWNDPKYHATLTGVYDGFSGRIKFVFTEKDDVPYELLYKYVMEKTGGRDLDTLQRKVHMASFNYKCGKYNEHLDSYPVGSQGGLIRLHYETSLENMLAKLNSDLEMVFDSYAVVRKEIIGPAPIFQGEDSPGPSKRKANDEPEDRLNEKKMRMN